MGHDKSRDGEEKFPCISSILSKAIIYSYLTDRTISYISETGVIQKRKITSGVPQGSVLGPLLWNVAYDVILRNGVYRGCQLLCYANDTLLIARGRNKEEALGIAEMSTNILINRIEEIGLRVALEKTEVVIFGTRRNDQPASFNIGGKDIETKTSMKYLGVIVDEEWNMRDHFYI